MSDGFVAADTSGLTDDDLDHAAEMVAEEQDDDEVDEYDYFADDLAFDAWRERGYR